jgi:hypothetical protein
VQVLIPETLPKIKPTNLQLLKISQGIQHGGNETDRTPQEFLVQNNILRSCVDMKRIFLVYLTF